MAEVLPCRTEKALFLGNSPALNHVDLRLVDRETTTVFAVNRVWRQDDPAFRWIWPDYWIVSDNEIEDEWAFPVGTLLAVLTRPGQRWAQRPDAITRDCVSHRKVQWPERGGRFITASGTPPYGFQWVVEAGFPKIGILGIDYTGGIMSTQYRQGKSTVPSHCYGHNPRATASPSMGSSTTGGGMMFWGRALQACRDRGIDLRNLCPYAEKTPFHRAGIPLMGFEEFCG